MPRHHLLLVDDSPEIAFIVKRFAKDADHDITSCRTVEEAWDWLKRGSTQADTDLVLLDMHLPGPSGLELCKRLRDDPSPLSTGERGEKAPPIAILSDWHRQDEIAAALEAGADYVLEKDLLCHPNKWQNRLEEILNDAHHRHFDSNIRLSEHGLLPGTPEQALAALDRAFRRLPGSRLGPQVLRVLFKKALVHSFTESEGNHTSPSIRLGSDSLAFDWEKVSPDVRLDRAKACWAQLMRQVTCVLGNDFTRQLRDVLKDPSQT